MSLIWAALIYPINDVTTSPEKPPAYVEIAKLDANKGRDLTYQDETRVRQRKLYPDLDSLRSPQAPVKLFKHALALVGKQPNWKIVYSDEANFRIEAVATTPLLKFSDDIVIEVRPEPDGSSFHMRSKSRIGRGDLGANHKRIKEFLELVQKP